MKNAWSLLFASRKFWIATLTMLAVLCATALVVTGKVSSGQLIPTIVAITTTGIAFIGSIAWEDTASIKANASGDASEALAKGMQAVAEKLSNPPPAFTVPEEEVTKP